jgi:hypothetical protein
MEPNILNYPNSQEGIDAYEADLAEYNRIQKGPMIGTELVDTIEDVVESGVEQISKVPILRTGLQFLGGAVRTIDQVMSKDQGVGGMVYRTYKNVKEASEEGFGNLAESVGVDRRIGEFGGGEFIDFVATAGAGTVVKRAKNVIDKLPPGGMAQQLATVGGMAAPSQMTPQVKGGQVFLSTTSPRWTAKGVTEGIADLPEFAGQLSRMEDRIIKSETRLKRWLGAEPGKVKSRNIKKSRDNLKGQASTGPSRIENKTDEGWYNIGNQNFVDEIGQTPQLGFERHHMFPKAESYIFVDRLRNLIKQGVADKDDMVNLFLYAEDAGAVMGNRKANMLLMEKIKQHGPHHRMREKTEGAYGMVMEPDNLQDLADVVNTAKSADELMELFDEYLIKNIAPSKRDAFQRVMQKSKDTIKETRMGSVLSEADRRRL